jgi:type I restriction enzyme R subunit
LAVWYYRLISQDKDFPSPLFQLPSKQDQQATQQAFQQEMTLLKQALAQTEKAALQNEHKSQAEIEAQQAKLIELQGRLSVFQSQQTETLAQSEARIAALEAQLKAKEDELASLTEQDRKAFHNQAKTQVSQNKLNLDEAETRYLIDEQLRLAGWDADTQNLKYSNGTRPEIGRNMAIAEWPTGTDEAELCNTGKGFADYVLFAGLTPVGVVEAKRYNIDVASKLNEAFRYSKTFDLLAYRKELAQRAANDDAMMAQVSELKTNQYNANGFNIPFCFSANGRGYSAAVKSKSGIWYRDTRLDSNQPDALPQWFTPEELLSKLDQNIGQLNNWFATHPDMSELGLRYYQEDAVRAVERAVLSGQRSALLAMATGTGKTRTAIAIIYRMIQSQRFKRVLFLVDRRSLGKQALDSFDEMRIQGQTFTSIFNIKGMTDRFPEDSTKIHVATVQSLVKRVLQSDEFIPVGLYDAIIIDEAHRGYILDKEQTEGEEAFRDQQEFISSYRRVIDQFDAFKLALTATPALHTTEIFGRPIYNYSYRTAVIDGYVNDYDPPIKINIKLNTQGVVIAEGEQVKRLEVSGELKLDTLEDEQNFDVDHFNRQIILPAFNQVICEELTKYLDPTSQQKTLIFCVNNDHADMVVEALRTAFIAKLGSLQYDAILKITGNADKNADKVQELITKFDKENRPNIVVTVDLMNKCNLHTILRLPTGIFYAAGVKTNVLFFQKGALDNPHQDVDCTQETWVYDMRTNMQTFGKRRMLTNAHFEGFIAAYGEDANGQSPRTEGIYQQLGEIDGLSTDEGDDTARWRKFSRDYIREQKGDSLDIAWLKDLEASNSENLPEPGILAGEAMAELTEAMSELYQLMQALGADDEAEAQKQLLEASFGLQEKAVEQSKEQGNKKGQGELFGGQA